MDRWTRRAVLAAGLTGAGATLAPGGDALAAPSLSKGAKGRSRPNVLFIAIDDLNDWTGWQGGYPLASTPNLDLLARYGAALRRAYTEAPVCQAARASVLFGRHPWTSGIYTNSCLNWNEVTPDRVSLPRVFKDAGYLTTYAGKIHHEGWRKNTPENDPTSWTDPLTHPDWTTSEKDKLSWRAEGTRETQEDIRFARMLVDAHLSKSHDAPFFAALGVRKPHPLWVVPQSYYDRFPEAEDLPYPLGALDRTNFDLSKNADIADLPPAGRAMARQHASEHLRIAGQGDWKPFVKGYLAAIAEADDAVGVALDGLLKGPNASNTVVVVWSDHGWQLGEKCTWKKFTLWERALRVPVIFAGPGVETRASDALFSTGDLYRTLTSLIGVDAPDDIEGVDHAAHLRGGPPARDALVSSWAFDPTSDDPTSISPSRRDLHFSVRTARHRLIAYGNGDLELYDHENDPFEWRNLAELKSEAGTVRRLLEEVPQRPSPPALGPGPVSEAEED